MTGMAIALALAGATLPAFTSAAEKDPERPHACGDEVGTPPAALAVADAERAVRCLVNRRRAGVGASPLHRSPTLTLAAHTHSAFMQQSACFAHVCPGEEPLEVRLASAGYLVDALRLWRFGEAIAWAGGEGGTPRGIVRRLMGSPPHKELLLDPRFEEIGVGFRYGTYRSEAEDGGLYTVDVGRRVGVAGPLDRRGL